MLVKDHLIGMESWQVKLTVFLFAGLTELLGASRLEIDVQDQSITAAALKKRLAAQYPHAAAVVEQCFIAKNQSYAEDCESLEENDEIALIPPVSGGQDTELIHKASDDQQRYAITGEPIYVEETTRKVMHPSHGATLSFVGTTREFTDGKRTVLLEYDAYVPMALRTMEQIGAEIDGRWPGTFVAITHRLGKVEIGEISVVIAVSSPHRNDAYEASRYAIERLKQIVPIWKKEVWEDGSEWKGHQQGPWNPSAPLAY
jgi:molybdopterin converting factor subunit 1